LHLLFSPFWPIAIGFFGLGTGYFIWGGQALLAIQGQPRGRSHDGMWGSGCPDLCQFLTGVYLIVGLTWFNVFGSAAPLYMAGLAFTVYGIHWFAMAHRRYTGSERRRRMDGRAIAYLFVSVLGAYVFWKGWRRSMMIIFIGLALIYLVEVQRRLAGWNGGSRLVALLQCLTEIWLMYCTWAVTVNLGCGYKLWI